MNHFATYVGKYDDFASESGKICLPYKITILIQLPHKYAET